MPLMLNTRPYINIYTPPSAIYILTFGVRAYIRHCGTFFLSVSKGQDITYVQV